MAVGQRREEEEAPWGSGAVFSKRRPAWQREREREGMKNMIYIIAVYCCYLVAAKGRTGQGISTRRGARWTDGQGRP